MGDIMRVTTTGASQATANQDGLRYSATQGDEHFEAFRRLYQTVGKSVCGVAASEKLAETDLGRMRRYYPTIKQVAARRGVDPYLIAGIISRESRAGNALVNGWGDNGKAFGLMQVDVTPTGGNHRARGAWDSEEHIDQGTEILVYFIGQIQRKFPNWSREQQLKGGIAAYNMGDGNVREGYDVDHFTTGRDYSNDVVARAQWYRRQGT